MACCKWRSCQQRSRFSLRDGLWQTMCTTYRFAMRALGPLLFLGANAVILSIALAFLCIFYPELYRTSPALFLVNLPVGLYLLVNIFFNYYACAWTAPGSPCYCPDPARLLGEKIHFVEGRKIYQFSYHLSVAPGVSYRYCHQCKCIKPPRAHHCSVLGRCVYHMDHYCPWVSNTVGYYNYRYFVLFLFFLVLACLYVIAFFLLGAITLSPVDRSFIYLNSMFRTHLFYADTLSASIFCFGLALSGLVSAGLLLLWHAYLTFTNQTSLEFYENFSRSNEPWLSATLSFFYPPAGSLHSQNSHSNANNHASNRSNPFDEGWRKNVRRVLGEVPWYRLLWPSRHLPPPPKYPFDLDGRDLQDVIHNV